MTACLKKQNYSTIFIIVTPEVFKFLVHPPKFKFERWHFRGKLKVWTQWWARSYLEAGDLPIDRQPNIHTPEPFKSYLAINMFLSWFKAQHWKTRVLTMYFYFITSKIVHCWFFTHIIICLILGFYVCPNNQNACNDRIYFNDLLKRKILII